MTIGEYTYCMNFLLVGAMVRFFEPHMGWFDRLLGYRPGFRRYIYGLARFLYPRQATKKG